MFARNIGSVDRAVRIVVGLALIAAYFIYPTATYRWAFLLGIVPLLTGLMGSCALYTLLGINTCRR